MTGIIALDRFFAHLERNVHGHLCDLWTGEAHEIEFGSLVDLASAWVRHFKKMDIQTGASLLVPMRVNRTSIGLLFGALQYGLLPVLIKPTMPANLMCDIVEKIGGSFVVATAATKSVFWARGYAVLGEEFEGSQVLCGPSKCELQKIHLPGLIGILSSGSTGMPKIIIHPFSNLLRNALMHIDAIGLDSSDTVVLNLPLNYSYGLVAGLLATLLAGSKGVLVDPQRVDMRRVLNAYGVTTCMGTPSSVLANFPADSLARLKRLTVGGDAMRANLALSLLSAMKCGEIFATYGLTEAGPRVATWRLEAPTIQHYQAVPLGVPLENVRLSLSENECDDAYRELLVETPTVMHGYLGDEAGTCAVLDRPGGTLRTGDLFGSRDGMLFFSGRLKRVIVRGGENIYPAFVEEAVMRFPDIEDVWVTGEAHDALGQIPIAYLISSKLIDVGALARELRRYLPTSHIPTRWEQVREFPVNIRK